MSPLGVEADSFTVKIVQYMSILLAENVCVDSSGEAQNCCLPCIGGGDRVTQTFEKDSAR